MKIMRIGEIEESELLLLISDTSAEAQCLPEVGTEVTGEIVEINVPDGRVLAIALRPQIEKEE